jgi:hypothetical protein
MLDQTAPPDYCGEWAGQKLHVVRETCFRILNTRPHLWESPTVQDGNFITCGRNEDYVGRKLTAMLELLAVATKLGDSVVWS